MIGDNKLTDEIQLIEEARALGIEVNPEWSETVLKRKITMEKNALQKAQEIADQGVAAIDEAVAQSPQKPKEAMVRLLRNYVPIDSVLDEGKPNPAYVPKYAENGKVEGQYPGVGQSNKIWSGSKIFLPIDEARSLVERRLAEIPADVLSL